MRKFLYPFAFVGAWLVQGCVPTEGGFGDAGTADESAEGGLGSGFRFDLERSFAIDAPPLPAVWRPRLHPPGTMLVDHSRDLWMVVTGLERRSIAGDDVLGEAGLSDHNAIRMSPDEERCVVPVADDEYWYPENGAWRPFYGPHEDDGLYLVDWEHRTRRPASIETLYSWGYSASRLDDYDGDMDEWDALSVLEEPLRFRDGTIARTEIATYYLLYGRAYIFVPQTLAEEAGYRLEDMLDIREALLRTLARVTTAFTRDYFDLCPAEGEAED
ncbi:MAG: hypothetical protein AAB668_02230 [Patescibacteria group bacterium]